METPVKMEDMNDDRDTESLPDASSNDDSRTIDVEVVNGPNGNGTGHSTSDQDDGDRFENLPDLGRMRQQLFEMRAPIELSEARFKTYWPYVDNVWARARPPLSKHGVTTEFFMCRLKRPTAKSRTVDGSIGSASKRPRNKRVREGGTCQMAVKVTHLEQPSATYVITQMNDAHDSHTHDLDYIDSVKRNSRIMGIARRETNKGYVPLSVHSVLHQEPQKLADAGGKFLSATDCRNVSMAWRAANPNVQLKFHDHYEYRRSLKSTGKRPLPSEQTTPQASPSGPNHTQQSATQSLAQPQSLPIHVHPNTLQFPEYAREFLLPYLPENSIHPKHRPHVTLTYASSLDSMLSLAPGTQTFLSGPESKAMTHFLRSTHDAILVGVGTVTADDPGLNCRIEGAGGFGGVGLELQPRPVILDPMARWGITPESRILRTAREGKGKAPWILVSPGAKIDSDRLTMLKSHGGNYLRLSEVLPNWRLRWDTVLGILANEGIRSVMIEGGGAVMSELLNTVFSPLVDSVIVTIAPTYLGRGGVLVSPASRADQYGQPIPVTRLHEVRWQPVGDDVVMCGKMRETLL